MDKPNGWTLELRQCQRPGWKGDRGHAVEEEARTALRAVYKLGEEIGTWRRRTYPSDAQSRIQERMAQHRALVSVERRPAASPIREPHLV